MALIKCPECGKGVSDRAKSCPSCGYPTNPPARPWKMKLILFGLSALAFYTASNLFTSDQITAAFISLVSSSVLFVGGCIVIHLEKIENQ